MDSIRNRRGKFRVGKRDEILLWKLFWFFLIFKTGKNLKKSTQASYNEVKANGAVHKLCHTPRWREWGEPSVTNSTLSSKN